MRRRVRRVESRRVGGLSPGVAGLRVALVLLLLLLLLLVIDVERGERALDVVDGDVAAAVVPDEVRRAGGRAPFVARRAPRGAADRARGILALRLLRLGGRLAAKVRLVFVAVGALVVFVFLLGVGRAGALRGLAGGSDLRLKSASTLEARRGHPPDAARRCAVGETLMPAHSRTSRRGRGDGMKVGGQRRDAGLGVDHLLMLRMVGVRVRRLEGDRKKKH